MGCGSGNNGPRVQSWSGGRVSGYVGLDARMHDDWKGIVDRQAECRFFRADVADISNHLSGDINLIMSQSAIEHFQNDVNFFSDIRMFLDRNPGPVIQVHLFPSAVGLRLYRWHGVRQYTPRTVSLLSSMFNHCSYSRLYRLGGAACNKVHMNLLILLCCLGRRRAVFVDRVQVLMSSACEQPSWPTAPVCSVRLLFTRW